MQQRVLALLSLLFSACGLQAQPVPPTYEGGIIFDDFTYADTTQLFGNSAWHTSLEAPFTHTTPDRAWYKANWTHDRFAPDAHLDVDGASHLRLSADAGHRTAYVENAGPPYLISGFSHRTGVWAARLRLDDIGEATVDLAQSFWLKSPYDAWETEAFKQEGRHWDEIDHEWNNFFNDALGEAQFMANGYVLDGAPKALYMQNPLRDGVLTCYQYEGGDFTPQERAACMRWFPNHPYGNSFDGDRMVDVMITYDGEELRFDAVAWDAGVDDFVVLQARTPLGRRTQPMTTLFSQLQRFDCNMPDVPAAKCILDRDHGFSIDWFFYTPETDLEIWDVTSNVEWLQAQGLGRVNTTGERVQAPAPPTALTLDVEQNAVYDTLEWTALPPLKRDGKYKVEWASRHKMTAGSAWSGRLARLVPAGFKHQTPRDAYQIEVRVRLSDYEEPSFTPVERCIGLTNGTSVYDCQ